MRSEHEASRTLVKSPPELWAECSDSDSLARHLKQSFGEIRITRLEPEKAIAWEGERASGTVRLEPSGWGTRVTLTARTNAHSHPISVGGEPEPSQEEVDETVEETPEEPDPVLGPDSPNEPDPVVAGDPALEADPALETDPALEADPAIETDPALEADPPLETDPALEADPAIETDRPPTPRRLRRLLARGRAVFRRREHGVSPAEVEPEQVEPEQVEPELAETEPVEPEQAEPVPAEPELAGPDLGSETDAETVPDASEPQIDPEAVLAAALDSLGQAHHRPFSRA